jgi:hypothetical protein
LGLDVHKTNSITIRITPDDVVIKVNQLMTSGEVPKLVSVMKNYNLVEKEHGKN